METILTVGIPPRAIDLVQQGVITIDVHHAKTGIDMWARSVQAHPRLAVYPHESYRVEDLIKKLEKVSVPKMKDTSAKATDVAIRTGTDAVKKVAGGATISKPRPFFNDLNHAVSYVKESGLDAVTVSGLKQFLPEKSLCYKDFLHNDIGLSARAWAVAGRLGTAKIVERIRTDSSLGVSGSTDLFSWWKNADSTKRFVVLSHQKQRGRPPKGAVLLEDGLSAEMHSRIEELECPFRDPEVAIYDLEFGDPDSSQELSE